MTIFNIFDAANTLGYTDVLQTLDDQDATLISATPTQIIAQVDQFTVNVLGSFVFNGAVLDGGVLQSVLMNVSGVPIAEVLGINLDLDLLISGTPAQINNALNGGADAITSAWNEGDIYETFGGNDQIQLGIGDDWVDGGAGLDRFIVQTGYAQTTMVMIGDALRLDGPQGTDTLRNIETLKFNDLTLTLVTGDITADTLGGDSNQLLLRDLMFGGTGDDTLSGGKDADILRGEDGNDTLMGDNGRDILYGGANNDVVSGGNSRDKILGGSGRDTLSGDGGSDRLFGQKGKDILIGGRGYDTLAGGENSDVFQFRKGHGDNLITDFEVGVDVIKIGLGAKRFDQLDFDKQGKDVLISFSDVTIQVEKVSLSAMRDVDNFDF